MDARTMLDRVVAGVGVVGLLALFPFYLASGLAAPMWAIVLLLAFWCFLGWIAVTRFTRTPWLVFALPFVAGGVWLGTLTVGEKLLGWQA